MRWTKNKGLRGLAALDVQRGAAGKRLIVQRVTAKEIFRKICDRTIEAGMATQLKPRLTPEEYLASERLAETKSEYYEGEVFPMSGASENHNLIVANLILSLGTSLRKRDCRVYPSDMRLLVSESGLYTYPDVMVVCGERIFAETQRDILTNPLLVIEVLSPSTEDYDRGGKFHQYMRIPSLQEYLTVSQTEMLIDQRVRQADNSWVIRELTPASGKVPLRSLGIELDFAEVYDKVEFETATSAPEKT